LATFPFFFDRFPPVPFTVRVSNPKVLCLNIQLFFVVFAPVHWNGRQFLIFASAFSFPDFFPQAFSFPPFFFFFPVQSGRFFLSSGDHLGLFEVNVLLLTFLVFFFFA